MSLRGRGAKRDQAETAARNFDDAKSFISLDGREFLAGDDWKEQKAKVWKRDKGMCQSMFSGFYLCGAKAVHVHHVVRKSRGGDDSLDNLVCLCAAHHREAHPEKQTRFGTDRRK
jgi:5-methylcytosine-specific restriction endonuclease McrA